MTRLLVLWLISFSGFISAASAEELPVRGARFKLGQTGTMMDPDSVVFENGEKVYSLELHSEEMKHADVRVEFFKDGGFDNSPHKNVELSPINSYSRYFVGVYGVASSPKRAAINGCTTSLYNVTSNEPATKNCSIKFATHEYQVTEERNKKIGYGRDGQTGFGGQILIRNGKFSKVFSFEYPFYLLWTGDLNGDGKIDIVTSELNTYGKENIKLYISEDPDRRALDELNLKREASLEEISGC